MRMIRAEIEAERTVEPTGAFGRYTVRQQLPAQHRGFCSTTDHPEERKIALHQRAPQDRSIRRVPFRHAQDEGVRGRCGYEFRGRIMRDDLEISRARKLI